jgi:hypothetical protein
LTAASSAAAEISGWPAEDDEVETDSSENGRRVAGGAVE